MPNFNTFLTMTVGLCCLTICTTYLSKPKLDFEISELKRMRSKNPRRMDRLKYDMFYIVTGEKLMETHSRTAIDPKHSRNTAEKYLDFMRHTQRGLFAKNNAQKVSEIMNL